jgi:hypothetical protein
MMNKVGPGQLRAAERLNEQRKRNAERLKDAPTPEISRQQMRAAERAGLKAIRSGLKADEAKAKGNPAAIR